MSTIDAKADDSYYNRRNAAGYIIFEHYPTFEVQITRNSQNLITREDPHYFSDDAPTARAQLTLAPQPVYRNTDLHAAFE